MKKIGVITEDYFQGFRNFEGDFYDSIANLLTTKTKDSDEYYFTGFKVKDRVCVNAIYSNPKTRCKLYLRNVQLVQEKASKRPASAVVRPLSSKQGNRSQVETQVERE